MESLLEIRILEGCTVFSGGHMEIVFVIEVPHFQRMLKYRKRSGCHLITKLVPFVYLV
jgi:hypothetical protein